MLIVRRGPRFAFSFLFYLERVPKPILSFGMEKGLLEQSPKKPAPMLDFYRNLAGGDTSCVAEPPSWDGLLCLPAAPPLSPARPVFPPLLP